MNKPFIEIEAENVVISGYDAKPVKEYEVPTNKETGELLPYCCQFHKDALEQANNWFDKYPTCHEFCLNTFNRYGLNKDNLKGLPIKIIKQLSYTEFVFLQSIEKEDWYKSITDYIDYNVDSFGQPAIGLHLYLHFLKHYIGTVKTEIPKEKRQRLTDFIDAYDHPPKTEKTDFNILYSTYQKWLKIFPFELSYFTQLKPQFEKQLPILDGTPETNKYTGLSKGKVHTKSSLINLLLDLTNRLLTEINSHSLYEKGLLTEPQKLKLELVLNERKMKLKQGYVNNSPNEEQRYRKILKDWYRDEKMFIDEITPLLKALPPQPADKEKPVLQEKHISFNSSETVDRLHTELKGYFPEKEKELLKALQGQRLTELLLFPHNQNKFVEVFKRAKYNSFILSSPTEIMNWICSNFVYRKKQGSKITVEKFNKNSVWDILTKNKGEPSLKERICQAGWLPFKTYSQRKKDSH